MAFQAPSGPIGTPLSDIRIDADLVRMLLADQHPDLAHFSLQLVDEGWDNVIFRLGSQWSVRLPRREAAATLIEHEQTWLPLLAQRLPFPVPAPYRLGRPAFDYPWRWSIVPWFSGVSANLDEINAAQAKPFADFLKALHVPAPANAPINKVRGGPLHERAAAVQERMERLERKTNLITPLLKRTWEHALQTPIDVPSTWLHGDLHPRNVLVKNGAITAIIDWGDITAGDIATDLASIWMLFADKTARYEVMSLYSPLSDATLARAKGWTILFGVVLLDTGLVDNPQHAIMGERALRRIVEDESER